MKVLMQSRPDAFVNSGGDTVQMIQTKKELQKLGVDVDISVELTPDLSAYDIVHLFNISRVNETWVQYKNAKKQRKKVVVSTIYHYKKEIREYEEKELFKDNRYLTKLLKNENLLEFIKSCVRCKKSYISIKTLKNQFVIGYKKQQEEIVYGCDMLLPNSQKELECILEELKIYEKLANRIIPNGVSIIEEEMVSSELENLLPKKRYVFCAGRIEPLKNQLNLIKGLKGLDMEIVFAGALNNKHKKYCNNFLNEVEENKNIKYLGVIKKEEMNYLYRNAYVTIMPSWFETTGLTGIESMFNGTPAIVTKRGYTKEYYGDFVEYCNPDELWKIKTLIENNKMEINDCMGFREKIINEFNWMEAAKLTKEAYIEVMSSKEKR